MSADSSLSPNPSRKVKPPEILDAISARDLEVDGSGGGITLAKIAQRCNVSRIAVSQALSGSGRLSPQTRQRIIDTAQQMGYRPNHIARTMRSGRFNSIGVVQSESVGGGWLPDAMLFGIHQAVAAHDLHLMLARLPEEDWDVAGLTESAGQDAKSSKGEPAAKEDVPLRIRETAPRLLREWACDGLLINYIHAVPKGLVEVLQRQKIPTIWLNARRDSDCIHPDDRGSAHELTRHLLELGHKNIGFVDYGPHDNVAHYSVADRRQGYETALREATLHPQIWHNPANLAYDQWVDLACEQLSTNTRPTALICLGETEALVVLQAAARLGIQVPQKLSVATFHHHTLPMVCLGVGCMELPEAEMGKQAVEMLLAKIENPSLIWPERAVACLFNAGKTIAPPHKVL